MSSRSCGGCTIDLSRGKRHELHTVPRALRYHQTVVALSIAAGLLTLLAYIPYVAGIVRRTTVPSAVSWWIWALVGLLLVSTYAAGGGKAALWLAGAALLGQVLVALLSIRYGRGAIGAVDIACAVAAIAIAALWWLTSSPYLPHALVLALDACAWFPTFRKTVSAPRSEDPWAWVLWTTGAVLSLLSVRSLGSFEAAYPVYIVVTDGLVTVAILRGLRRPPIR